MGLNYLLLLRFGNVRIGDWDDLGLGADGGAVGPNAFLRGSLIIRGLGAGVIIIVRGTGRYK